MTRSLTHVAIISVVLIGCGVETNAPQLPGPTTNKKAEQEDTTPGKIQPPVLDFGTIPKTTCNTHVAISGTAKPSATVFALGGAATAGISEDAHPTTGSFCLPVTLKKGQANTFEVRAQDPKLGVSSPVKVTITQQLCDGKKDDTTSTPTKTKPKNVAQGAKVRSKDSPDSGSGNKAVDGKKSTWVTYKGGGGLTGWTDYNGWVVVQLDKVYRISKIIVRWKDWSGSGNSYGKSYSVLISHDSSPGDPDLKNGKWTEAKKFTDGDGGVDTIPLDSKLPIVQHVALWLRKDGGWSWDETFSISEIEVWTAQDDSASAPPIKSNVCTGS